MRTLPILLLLLGGCASTDPTPLEPTSPAAARLTWPEDGRVLQWLQGAMPAELYRAPSLAVTLGPVSEAPPWYSAYVAQQRLAEFEQALRAMGYQGRVEGAYEPAIEADQVTLGQAYGY